MRVARALIIMAIIKEKKIKITSTIENLNENGISDGSPERTESVCEGFLKISDTELLLTYSESTEGGRIVSDISITKEGVKVMRRGAVRSDMYFSEGVTDKSLYEVSPYTFDVIVYTRKIRNNITKDGGRLDIYYDMKIGGADKNVIMKIEC